LNKARISKSLPADATHQALQAGEIRNKFKSQNAKFKSQKLKSNVISKC